MATATASDDEMARRIKRHQSLRSDGWGLVEAPVSLAHVLELQLSGTCLLVDCMGLWPSNLLHAGDEVLALEKLRFIETLSAHTGPVVIVSNEVGLGTIGMDPLPLRFCDEPGVAESGAGPGLRSGRDECGRAPLTLKAPT